MASWDRAVIAIDRAIARGHEHFTVLRRENGYMRIRHPNGSVVDVEIRIETPSSTLISLRSRRRRLPLFQKGRDRLIGGLHDDVLSQLRGITRT
jgi:hypothetical protein